MSYQSLVAFEGWTFIAQILNLFIQMYLFKKFLFKPIQNILAQRQQEVDTLYADADSAKQDAESAKAEYESHLLTARTEAEEITAELSRETTPGSIKNAQTRSDAMLASAQSEAAAMREKASRDIELERRKAMNEMKSEISGLAVEIASKVAEKEIDEKQHEALIERFIDELGEES